METSGYPPPEALSGNIEFLPFTIETLAGLLVLIVLLIISGLISGSEVALFSLEPKVIESLKSSRKHQAQLVIHLLSIPERLLASILVGNNFVNIAIVLLAAHISDTLIDFSNVPTFGFIFQTVIITFLILLFGEIIPKIYAAHYSKRLALQLAPMINFLEKITRPLNYILIHSTSFVNKRMAKHKRNISIDEISQALKLTDRAELSEDKEILEGIVTFGSKSVSEIMRSRLDVISIEVHSDFEEVLHVIRESGYSRIPVYSGSLDNVRGILYIKDLLPHISKGASFRWQQLMRPPFFIPETKKIDDLLEEFQKSKVHMAIVIDEFGGTSGLVTLEDILEEIVGNIEDEFDVEERFFTKISQNEYVFDGKTLLNDFYKALDIPDDLFEDVRGEADTLAGLILELTGEFPAVNEKVKCKYFIFEIDSIDTRRIKKIRVTLNPPVKAL